jgi:formylglycine-generating enzyme required for sulfatase activity
MPAALAPGTKVYLAGTVDMRKGFDGLASSIRVYRGGSWIDVPGYLRSAFRGRYVPNYGFSYLGFRVARNLD